MKITFFCLIALSLTCCTPENSAESDISHSAVEFSSPPAIRSPSVSVSHASSPPSQDTRKLIRQGSLIFEVKNVDNTYDSVKLIIKNFHGYSSDEATVNNDRKTEQRIDICIEEKYFDEVIGRLLALATKVENRSIDVRDVTERYTDITARLKAKKEVELRYIEILHQAKTVKDMLAIEEQLGTIREEIESMEAQLKLMSNQVAYSTIQIRFSEHIVTPQEPESGMGSRLVLSIREGWNNLMSLILALVALWPLLLGIGSLCVIVIRLIRRRRKVVADPVIG